MFKNHLKIAVRNISKQKGFSFINITGLAIGKACFFLILVWILNELNYDSFHNEVDNIHLVPLTLHSADGNNITWNLSSGPVGPELKDRFPEIEKYVRFSVYPKEFLLQHNNRKFKEQEIYMVDNTFFDILHHISLLNFKTYCFFAQRFIMSP